MPVYVDEARHRFGRMLMCHMIADTAAELHQMADVIGVARRWYQVAGGPNPASFPHYDIAKIKRAMAIDRGAIELLDRREYVERMRQIRITIIEDPVPWRWVASCNVQPPSS